MKRRLFRLIEVAGVIDFGCQPIDASPRGDSDVAHESQQRAVERREPDEARAAKVKRRRERQFSESANRCRRVGGSDLHGKRQVAPAILGPTLSAAPLTASSAQAASATSDRSG